MCTEPADDATSGGGTKRRLGKRERARLRSFQQRTGKGTPGGKAADGDHERPKVSLRQHLPTRYKGSADLSTTQQASTGGSSGKEQEPSIAEILAEMRETTVQDALRRIVTDPECGVPDDAELTEIYLRYERGLPLSDRQQIWLDATSDVSTRPYAVLNNSCIPPPRPAACNPLMPPELPPFYYKPILGCGDFANCADCRHRYHLPANYTPPIEGRPSNASEFLQRFFAGGKLLLEEMRRLRREEGPDAVARMFDSEEDIPDHVCPVHIDGQHHAFELVDAPTADDNTTMSEQEALTTIYKRLAVSSSVSDFNMRRALQVASPHCRPWTLSRQGLIDEITSIRKRLAISDHVQARILVGEETEAVVHAVRAYGLVVWLPILGRKAFLSLSNVGLGHAVRAGERVRVYDTSTQNRKSQRLLEEFGPGASLAVEVVKVSPLGRFMVEVSRRALLLRRKSSDPAEDAREVAEIERAIDFLSAWQRAAPPPNVTNTNGATRKDARAVLSKRGVVRRPRTRPRAWAQGT